MDKKFPHVLGVVAFASVGLAGIGLSLLGPAFAQDATVESGQKQDFPAQPQRPGETKVLDGTVPPPPHAQPKAPLADLSKPAAVGPAQANTNGSMDDAIPPGATSQTMPSTISEQNAALDRLPTGAFQLPLTEETRNLIAQNLQSTPDTDGAGDFSELDVTATLPTVVPLQSFPVNVTLNVPETGRYKYIKRDSVVYIIDPPNFTVVGKVPL